MSHLIEVRIENIYDDGVALGAWPDAMVVENEQVKKAEAISDDRPNVASVTLEIEVPDLPDFTASDETWDEWAYDMIFPFTGIGKTEGDAGYFAEITAVLPPAEGYTVDQAEFAHVIGRAFEWGI